LRRKIFEGENKALVNIFERNILKKSNTFQAKIRDSPMPYNQSYNTNWDMGGEVFDLDVTGQLFAGTNFDCNETTFNYEALAEAKGTITLFGDSHDVFLAEAVYGKVNGAPEADELLLTVWDDVIYQEPIPQVDCALHTYTIFHEAPGFDVSYTLWISIVPISFTASASVDVNLEWGWQICDSSLLAMIELIPTAAPQMFGQAEIDLYIIKAGIELTGSASISVVPQGYIHGSECTIGFDVQQINPPCDVELFSYYAWQSCTLFFFDCHWGQQDQQVWYNYNYPAQDIVLFEQDWKIAG